MRGSLILGDIEMFKFSDSERAWHSEMRGLATDEQGREVLVGLTMDETIFYTTYSRTRAAGDPDRDPDNRGRFLKLRQKHEVARIQVIAAENELRVGNPSRN
jgi:hypothetical protein